MRRRRAPSVGLAKSPSGINGFDQITLGGLPSGRTSLVCGGAGCGKTMFAVEFLVKGAPAADQNVKIAAPQVKPEPNTDDRIRSPRWTLPCWRQWSMVSGTVAAVVLP